jgi:hypothetical protein
MMAFGGGLESLQSYSLCSAGPAAAPAAAWSDKGGSKKRAMLKSAVRTRGISGQSAGGILMPDSMPDVPVADSGEDMDFDSEETVKTLDIAAGAKIDQKVYLDPNDLDFWQEKPAGMLYINYTPTEQAIAILKKGKKDLTKGGEGFLAGLKTGK